MSALDMVVQRPVPSRPTGRMGQPGSDHAGGKPGDQPFSAVLSGEKRETVRETGRTGTRGEPAVPATQAGEQDPATVEAPIADPHTANESEGSSAQSDEMLALLESLMSSAAFPEEAKLGVAEDVLPEAGAVDAVLPDTADATEIDTDTDTDTVTDADMDTDIDIDDAAELIAEFAAPVSNQAGQPSQAPVVATTMASATRQTTQTGEVVASQRSGDPALAKNGPSRAAPDGTKTSTEENEALRASGLNSETSPIKSDGRKSSSDGRFAGNNDRPAQSDRMAEANPDAKLRNVEVLESRRFAALQPLSANGQMLSRSLIDAGQPLFAAQRAAPAQPTSVPGQPQPGQMLHTLKLQLNPLSLGSVTAVLKLSGEELSVDIKVETIEAYRQLTDDNKAILKSLRSQGYGVEQITIQHVPGPDRSAAQAAQAGFQPGSSGSGSADAQASGKQSGGQGTGQQGNSQNGGQGHEQNSHVGSGAGRTDGVYL
ncbi:flagellar hook-length control protein FliK [Hoeflea sp. Naph1]|uniref:flagellar hook-length control protein FliK n=1 Tax=Hoeflea sp. Naph1 TaxID=3388653 RepID=UPI0039902D43